MTNTLIDVETKILQTAAEILSEVGLAGLTIEEVTRRSGVAKTTIYRRYDSANELAITAMGQFFSSRLPEPDTGSLYGDLLVIYRRLAVISSDPGFRTAVFSLLAGTSEDPELLLVYRKLALHRTRPIEEVLERALARGEIRPISDNTWDLVQGPLIYACMLSHRSLSESDIEEMASSAVKALA